MKYLMLFEAFESSTISKVNKFVNSKFGKNSSDNFLDDLKSMIKGFDIPISKIQDEDVQYLKKDKAFYLRDKDVKNDYQISHLKFWFSIENGYLGYSGSGNLQLPVISKNINNQFTQSQLDYIRDELMIKTGIIKPVTDYKILKKGDDVIGIFSDDSDDIDRLTIAKIWREGNKIWAIQEIADGGYPDGTLWEQYGQYSWSLSSVDSPADDHYLLHHYYVSNTPLDYAEKTIPLGENPLEWNLPLRNNNKLSSWNAGTSIDKKSIEEADFCVVINLDNLLKKTSDGVKDIRLKREEEKKGAIKLLSDEDLKNINIKNYITKIVGLMNIKIDAKEVNDLQKIMKRFLKGKFSFITIYKNKPSVDVLNSICNDIKYLLSPDNDEKAYTLDRITDNVERISSTNYISPLMESEKILKVSESQSKNFSEVFEKIYEIGRLIEIALTNQNINTYGELKTNVYLINSIKSITTDYEIGLSDKLRRILNGFDSPGDLEFYLSRWNYSESEKLDDLERLTIIEKYIKRFLG